MPRSRAPLAAAGALALAAAVAAGVWAVKRGEGATPAPAEAPTATPTATPTPIATPTPAPTPAVTSPDESYRKAFESAERKAQSANFLGAVSDYRKALLFRETSEALAGLGRALFDASQPGPALDALKRAVQIDPNNAEAWVTLGEVYLLDDRTREARAAYERYLELRPDGRFAADVRAVLARMR